MKNDEIVKTDKAPNEPEKKTNAELSEEELDNVAGKRRNILHAQAHRSDKGIKSYE